MTDNSRPPDWAVARAFYEAKEKYRNAYSPWFVFGLEQIEEMAREIAEGAGDDVVEVKDG